MFKEEGSLSERGEFLKEVSPGKGVFSKVMHFQKKMSVQKVAILKKLSFQKRCQERRLSVRGVFPKMVISEKGFFLE